MKTCVLLTLAGLFILWGNPASSQPIIYVWGTADSLARSQVTQYLDYLDVNENVYVSVGFTTGLPEKLEGMTFCLNPSASNYYLFIKVLIDGRLKKMQQRLVLAHEMIHVKQYAKGEFLVINNQQGYGKDKSFGTRKPSTASEHSGNWKLTKRINGWQDNISHSRKLLL